MKEYISLKGASLINFYELIDKIKTQDIKKIHYTYKNNYNFFFKDHYLIQAESYQHQKYYCQIPTSFYSNFLFYINKYKSFSTIVISDTKYNFLEVYIRIVFFLSSFIFMFYIASNLGKLLFHYRNSFSHHLYQNQKKTNITFHHIAGLITEKIEIQEFIDFLKQPQKYQNIGLTIPKGVLLEGPPGTGKTLLAQALANKADVPFYSFSGSEFVEIYVGLGASRIRNLFQEIKNNSPCVLFIDEIDTLGAKRGISLHSVHQEKDQTLNQLLTEMDGFNPLTQIVVIAATNRVDILDPALLRPGRFDRIIKINLPDLEARKAILTLHAQNKKIAKNFDFSYLAQQTQGLNGAQLAAILNEASILTLRLKQEFIDEKILEQALNRLLMGFNPKYHKHSLEEQKIISYHEAGRAIISLKVPLAPKLKEFTRDSHKIQKDYHSNCLEQNFDLTSLQKKIALITYYLGGKAAEQLIFNDFFDLFDDFNQTKIIAQLILDKYTINDINSLNVTNMMNPAIKHIISFCFSEAQQIIKANQTLLTTIAQTLLQQENVNLDDINGLS
ncbi:AAA family ATPase [Candidatus Phytoplasma meliae]|nr:AAA family ATPase [Candidatus Phytoplasma meliae]